MNLSEATPEQRKEAFSTQRWCIRTYGDGDPDYKYGAPVTACFGDGHICTSCPAAKDHPKDPRRY